MLNIVLPVWGVALLISLSCWSIGARLVQSKNPLVGMLCGWCLFLFLCSLPWMIGVSANALRPFFWAFFLAGLFLTVRDRRWREVICALVCTTAIAAIFGAPFIKFPGLLAYGAHGTDMWGYVMAAEWIQTHSYLQLPQPGIDPMRFNWTYHVLSIHERPLNYTSLSCIASASGLSAVNAYLAYPVTLLASLAMALAREERVFRLRYWALAVVPAVVVAVHPLIVLPWIAGFFGGSIAAGFVAMGFAGCVGAEKGPARTEALALSTLMIVFCAALYTQKFILVALVVGGFPALMPVVVMALSHDFSPWRTLRPGRFAGWVMIFTGLVGLGLLLLGRDQPPNTGIDESARTAAGHFLGIFGGSSPFVWLGYAFSRDFDRIMTSNPVGLTALVVMLALFGIVALTRWRDSRNLQADLQVPLMVALAICAIAMAYDDELIMAKALAVFGFTLLYLLAAVSSQLRHWTLGLIALAVCCLPGIRSAAEMEEILRGPYIECTVDNLSQDIDGQDWRFLAFLYFREDKERLDWHKFPKSYVSIAHFLPDAEQRRIRKRYQLPDSY